MSGLRMFVFLVIAFVIAIIVSLSIHSRPEWLSRFKKGKDLHPEDRAFIFLLIFFPAFVILSVYENYSLQSKFVNKDEVHQINVNKENIAKPDTLTFHKENVVTENNLNYEVLEPADIPYNIKEMPGFTNVKEKATHFVSLLKRYDSSLKTKTIVPKGLLIYGQNGNGTQDLALAIAKEWGQKVLIIDAYDINGYDTGRLRLSDLALQSAKYSPSVVVIKNIDYILPAATGDDFVLQPKERLYKWFDDLYRANHPTLIIGITNDIYKMDPRAFSPKYFAENIHVEYPDLNERIELLKSLFQENNIKQVNLTEYANKTEFFSREYIRGIVNESKLIANKNNNKNISAADFQLAFAKIANLNEESRQRAKLAAGQREFNILTPSEINMTFADIFGNDAVKKELNKVIDYLNHPEKYENDNASISRGVLLYGPPGTGKTSMARALAGEAQVNFISVTGSEFITQWSGEGATRIRKVFDLARSHAPCIIFIDEFDALGIKRLNESAAMRDEAQIVNQLLSELDNLDTYKNKGVFVIAATNRINVIDEALLRPGRLETTLEMTLPDDAGRKQFIEHLLKAKQIKLNFDIQEIVKVTKGFSQAELKSLVEKGNQLAKEQKRNKIDKKDLLMVIDEIDKQSIAVSKLNVDLPVEIYRPSQIKANFQSIIGLGDVKKELSQMIYLLKNPEKIENTGVKIPKGWIFYGPPGTGKTSLARAVAGESGVNFISTTGSAFVEQWVGLGAQRVRELFELAREYRPCIIFIDEMDALASKRQQNEGSQEYAQTVNEFLAELDNIDEERNAGIVVIGATNLLDKIDDAVLRGGRLGKKVYIRLPTLDEREDLLKLFLGRIKIPNSVDITKLSGATMGFSGADLENLVNETALHILEKSADKITMQDIEEIKDSILFGRKTFTRVQPEERERTAYHEAGHALVGIYSKHYPFKFYKITLGIRDETLGITHFYEEEEHYSQTREALVDIIATKLAGKIAEEMIYGKNAVTSGPASDLKDATLIAQNMVMEYGMGGVGAYIAYNYMKEIPGSEVFKQVQAILDDAAKKAQDILTTNRAKLDSLAKALLKKEVLDYAEVVKIVK